MSSALFIVTIDTVLETVTIKDNGSDVDPTTITIYFNGEDKLTSNAIVTKTITDNTTINNFFNPTLGIVYTYLDLFGVDKPVDNFYVVQVVFDVGLETQLISNKIGISFTYTIAELIHRSVIGVHIPIDDLAESLRVGSMPQILEYLQVLSTDAVYTYDREIKWRKAYNYLNTIVNDLDY